MAEAQGRVARDSALAVQDLSDPVSWNLKAAAKFGRAQVKCLELLIVDADAVLAFDREANRLGVTRESLIKMWLADKLGHKKAISRR